jgi:hypothetical protein
MSSVHAKYGKSQKSKRTEKMAHPYPEGSSKDSSQIQKL